MSIRTVKTTKSTAGRLLRAAVCAGAALLCGPWSMAYGMDHDDNIVNVADGQFWGGVMQMDVGRSTALRTPWVIKRVSVADPGVADVEVLEPQEVLVVTKGMGITDLMIWGENGEIWSSEVHVDVNPERLNADLSQLFPRSSLKVTRSEDVYFVGGMLERAEEVEQLHKFMETAQLKFVDMTTVAGLHQVQIQVRVAEVNRLAIKNMGVNALYGGDRFIGTSAVGTATGGSANPLGIGHTGGASAAGNIPFVFQDGGAGTSPFVTLFAGFPNSDLSFFIQALAENQYLRVLAEPTLVALSGEEASFLAGGEFPIPVVQGGGAGGGTSISIEYKEFGVRLEFKPTVLGDGTIRLHVAPEVSELSDFGAVEIEGFKIPSILARRAETTVEMRSGQTFSLAGLLNESTAARNSRVPLLGDLPILGQLFRSVSYQSGQSELVVLVTATLVEPVSYAERPPLPGDLYVEPSDWEIFVEGRIEGRSVVDSDGAPASEELSKLKGPGAWASYEGEEPVQSASAAGLND